MNSFSIGLSPILLSYLCDYIPDTFEVLQGHSFTGGENVVAVLVDVVVGGKGVVLTCANDDVEGLSTRGRRIARVNDGIHVACAELDALDMLLR